jgi:hypothetical protein
MKGRGPVFLLEEMGRTAVYGEICILFDALISQNIDDTFDHKIYTGIGRRVYLVKA